MKGWVIVFRSSLSSATRLGRLRRATAFGVALAAAGAALSACGPVHAGAAATVGGDRITTGQLKELVQRTLADPTFAANGGSDVSNLQRQELTNLVQHRLLNLAAAQEHVSVSDGEVSQQVSAIQQQEGSKEKLEADAAQNGIAANDIHDYFYYNLIEQKLAPKITTPVVHAAHILVKDKATAQKILGEVQADPSQFASIAKSQSTDTQSGANGGDLGTVPSAEFVSEFAQAVDSAKVGSYFVVQSQFGWHVVHLISRSSESLQDLVTAAQQSGDSNAQQVAGEVMSRYLDSIAEKVGGVSVNPRYGVWSPAQAAIVASTGSLVSSAPSQAASQGS